MPSPGISIRVPINGTFRRKSIAYFNDPQYRRTSSGITSAKYRTLEVHSSFKKEDLIEYRVVMEFRPKDQMKVGPISRICLGTNFIT